jgi:hypothetical protein
MKNGSKSLKFGVESCTSEHGDSLAAMGVPCLDQGALGTDQRDPPVE